MGIDPFLEYGGNSFIGMNQIGKLINGDYQSLIIVFSRYEFSGLKSKSLKRRSDQRYAHFSIIGM